MFEKVNWGAANALAFSHMNRSVVSEELENVENHSNLAQHIRFSPIHAHEISLPEGIGHSSIVLFIANFTIRYS